MKPVTWFPVWLPLFHSLCFLCEWLRNRFQTWVDITFKTHLYRWPFMLLPTCLLLWLLTWLPILLLAWLWTWLPTLYFHMASRPPSHSTSLVASHLASHVPSNVTPPYYFRSALLGGFRDYFLWTFSPLTSWGSQMSRVSTSSSGRSGNPKVMGSNLDLAISNPCQVNPMNF